MSSSYNFMYYRKCLHHILSCITWNVVFINCHVFKDLACAVFTQVPHVVLPSPRTALTSPTPDTQAHTALRDHVNGQSPKNNLVGPQIPTSPNVCIFQVFYNCLCRA